ARKSRACFLRCCDPQSERRNHRATEEIYRPDDEQRRRILRAHRCARLGAVESRSRVAHRERFGTAREPDARALQGEERRTETTLRARKENVSNIFFIPNRPRLPRTKRRSGCTRQRSPRRSLRKTA